MKKLLLTTLPLFALTSCLNLHKVETTEMRYKGDYYSALAKEYSNMAKEKSKSYEWIDAERFAAKSVKSSKYREVTLEDPKDWNIKADLQVEFQEYYDLVNMLRTPENKHKHPLHLARLVASYDAMVEEQAENSNVEKILSARDKFIKNLRFFLGETAFLNHEEVLDSEVVFFTKSGHKLNKFNKKLLKRSLRKVTPEGIALFSKVIISAHADKPGSRAYNEKISLKRAAAVKNALVELGVSEKMIEIVNYGESKPVINTQDSNYRNRRVEVDFVR